MNMRGDSMDLLTSLFTQKELIIMGGVIGGLLLLVILFTIMTLLEKRKESNDEFNELEKIEEESSNEGILSIEESPKVVPVEEPVLIAKKKEPVVVKEEVKKVEEPLIMEIEEEPEDVVEEIQLSTMEKAKEELLKVEEELQNPKSLEDTITSLEAMEEESAIISYQELLETTKEMNVVETDSGDELISINELLEKYNESKIKAEMTEVSMEDAYQGVFISSPYLSPIEGVESQNLNEIQLENTANLEKLDKEIRKTNEFLNILNELKKNLE